MYRDVKDSICVQGIDSKSGMGNMTEKGECSDSNNRRRKLEGWIKWHARCTWRISRLEIWRETSGLLLGTWNITVYLIQPCQYSFIEHPQSTADPSPGEENLPMVSWKTPAPVIEVGKENVLTSLLSLLRTLERWLCAPCWQPRNLGFEMSHRLEQLQFSLADKASS